MWIATTVPGALVAAVWTIAVLRLAGQADDRVAAGREQAGYDAQFWAIAASSGLFAIEPKETDQ